MVIPNYKDGSIVNLMSSILEGFDVESIYPPMKDFTSTSGGEKKNFILMVVDGLGYNYLEKKGEGTILKDNLDSKLTSVFPSSTASAIPSFLTGTSPMQHGLTGWFMFMKEIGMHSTILPFRSTFSDDSLTEYGLKAEDILGSPSIFDQISMDSYVVTNDKIRDSYISKVLSGDAKIFGYRNLKEFFKILKNTLGKNDKEKFIYAYWNKFDSIAHEYGINSIESSQHFLELDLEFNKFFNDIQKTDTKVIITSDHGFVDTTDERCLRYENHPELLDCLTLPPCGDFRTIYFYVHPSKVEKFKSYWQRELSDYSYLHRSDELIEKNYFGLYESNPNLEDRIGDYVMVMKDNYTFSYNFSSEDETFLIGNHGGITEDEMMVPLIRVEV